MAPAPLRLLLIGPHGVGKTTLGRALAHRLQAEYQPEIGRLLREEALRRHGHHAETRDPEFDRAVIEAELKRDASLPSRAVLETGHPGNLAYAQARSPEVARALHHRVRRAVKNLEGLIVLPLTASRTVLRARATELDDHPEARLDFFSRVAEQTLRRSLAWGLTCLPAIDTGRHDRETTLNLACGLVVSARPDLWSRLAF